jgi:cation diffusion facilitator family transporter
MALLADGWHMATHASALGITFFTFLLMKKLKYDSSFAFGTWKIEILGAYTSAILLAIVGLGVIYSSVERLLHPAVIQYDQALIVTFIGLGVNVVCAFILTTGKNPDADHHHSREHGHDHEHGLGIKSAYLHVIADALTSIFAIIALLGAKLLKLNFLDPVMGIVSSVLIFKWSFDLIRETSSILLDRNTDKELTEEIKTIIEGDGDTKISDLHLWKVAEELYACIISLVAEKPKKIEQYKNMLKPVHELVHTSIEIEKCRKSK